jgi:hypothetical protein
MNLGSLAKYFRRLRLGARLGIFVASALLLSFCKPARDDGSLKDEAVAASGGFFVSNYTTDLSKLKELLIDKALKADIDAKASLFSVSFLDLIGLGGQYGISISDYGEDAFQRVDRWRVGLSIEPGTLLIDQLGHSLPIFLSLKTGREVEYSRLFATKKEALKALPKTAFDLPLTPAAVQQMAVGDFVSLPVQMGLRIGLKDTVTGGALEPAASAGLFWSGEFRLNFTKLDDSHIRVKVAPSTAKGLFLTTQVAARLDLFGYGPFGLIDMDRQVERALGLNLFQYSQERVYDAERLAVDYVFDMRDNEAQAAYAGVVARTLKINEVALAQQLAFRQDLQGMAIADLTLAELISQLDRDRPAERRRVSRVFRGSNAYTGSTASGHLGTKILRTQSARSLTYNWVRTTDAQDHDEFYIYPVFNDSRGVASFFAAARRQYQISAVSIFEADADWRNPRFRDLVFTWDTDERQFSAQEIADYRGGLKAVLGGYYPSLRVDEGLPPAAVKRFRAKTSVVVHPQLFQAMDASAAADPVLYEKQLLYALWCITPQFEGRLGPKTPGSPANVVGGIQNFLKYTAAAARQVVTSALTLHWQGIHGATGMDLVRMSLAIRQLGPMGYMTEMMKLLNKDESAQEIVPAYLLALGALFQRYPYAEVSFEAEGRPPFRQTVAENPEAPLHELISATLYRINNNGLER